MGAKLAATVFVRRPGTSETVQLDAGTEPPAELAALVTNPAAWEGGEVPTATKTKDTPAKATSDKAAGGDSSADKPARKPAARKTAADEPARGRTTAAEGTGGQ